MTNLTKEELLDLFDCCKAAYISGAIDPQIPLRVKMKICSMLESYIEPCEHYWIAQPVEYKVESNPIPNPLPPTLVKCKHCGVTNE